MKTLLSFSIPSIAFVVAGAWSLQHTPESVTTTHADALSVVVQSTPVVPKIPKIRATEKTVYRGESLNLEFAAPNPPFLGVVDPSGHFFYVVFPSEAAVGQLKPFVDSEKFTSLSSLEIDTRSFSADPYTYGVYTNQPVFTKSGTYTFIMGENLHIDDPAFVDKVEIQYVHQSRPAVAMAD